MPQSWDMEQILSLHLRRKAWGGFFSHYRHKLGRTSVLRCTYVILSGLVIFNWTKFVIRASRIVLKEITVASLHWAQPACFHFQRERYCTVPHVLARVWHHANAGSPSSESDIVISMHVLMFQLLKAVPATRERLHHSLNEISLARMYTRRRKVA